MGIEARHLRWGWGGACHGGWSPPLGVPAGVLTTILLRSTTI